MKTIKIFLASSSELKEDRDNFKEFLYDKTIAWKNKGVFLEIVRWEEFLDHVSATRLQDEYNKAIADCDIFVLLFFTKAGNYTNEEFDVAYNQFKQTGKPLIYTYFKDAEVKQHKAKKEDLLSLWALQEKLNNIGHFYTTYKNSEDLLLKFNQQLDKIAESGFLLTNITDDSDTEKSNINYKSYISQLTEITATNNNLNKQVQELDQRIKSYQNEVSKGINKEAEHEYINTTLKEILNSVGRDARKKNIRNILVAISAAIIAFLIIFYYYTYNEPTSVTVFVHGKNGKQDFVLRQNGYIIMGINGEQKKMLIDADGKAIYQNLHAGDKVSLDVDFSEPYHPVNRDSIYTIKKNSGIYLEVTLPLELVFGRVFWNNEPLENVIVSIGDLKDTTDVLGNFNIHIPENLQQKQQEVNFYKTGFTYKTVPAFPQTQQSLDVLMEKNK